MSDDSITMLAYCCEKCGANTTVGSEEPRANSGRCYQCWLPKRIEALELENARLERRLAAVLAVCSEPEPFDLHPKDDLVIGRLRQQLKKVRAAAEGEGTK